MRKARTKRDNSGLTLIEVIIAVSVFSIAAMIFLQGFVTSGRINSKAKAKLDATTVAQNVMEGVKSKDFPELSLAFNYPLDNLTNTLRLNFLSDQLTDYQNGTLGIKEMIRDGDTYKDVRLYRASDGDDETQIKENVTASVISKDNGRTYEFNPREKGKNESKYYFQITGIKGETQQYDALVEFDGSKDSGYKKKTSTSTESGKNDYLAPNISKLDTESNAFLIMPKNWDEDAMKTLVELQNERALDLWRTAGSVEGEEPAKMDPDAVYEQTKRTLYVKIEESGGIVKAEAKYTLDAFGYSVEGGSKYENMNVCPVHGEKQAGDNSTVCTCTYESAYVPFYSSEADGELKNIYVFYYPNYNSKSSVNPLDEIVFDNTTNYGVQLYVSKQRDDANSVPTSQQENAYKMSLTVQESPSMRGQSNWNTNPSLYRACTVLRTNLDYNISDPEKILDRPRISQMKLSYQDIKNGTAQKKVTGASAKKVLDYNGLDDKKTQDRIYTAKVSIYKAGAAAKGFPDDELLATLDGAKEN